MEKGYAALDVGEVLCEERAGAPEGGTWEVPGGLRQLQLGGGFPEGVGALEDVREGPLMRLARAGRQVQGTPRGHEEREGAFSRG